jgi:hypothetical protein
MCRSRALGLVAALAAIIVFVSPAPPALVQEPAFTETFDDPALPAWEHSP